MSKESLEELRNKAEKSLQSKIVFEEEKDDEHNTGDERTRIGYFWQRFKDRNLFGLIVICLFGSPLFFMYGIDGILDVFIQMLILGIPYFITLFGVALYLFIRLLITGYSKDRINTFFTGKDALDNKIVILGVTCGISWIPPLIIPMIGTYGIKFDFGYILIILILIIIYVLLLRFLIKNTCNKI